MADPLTHTPFATLCVPPGQALRTQLVAGLPPGGRRPPILPLTSLLTRPLAVTAS